MHAVLEQQLESGAAAMGLALSDTQRAQLLTLLQLLQRWNRHYNLTAVREPAQMVSRHVLDSLSVLPWIEGSESVLDIGTGAGLPGLPLAICAPQSQFVLLDSNGKKTRFVTQAKIELNLPHVQVCKSRIEDYRAASSEVVVSRAFRALPAFMESCAQHAHGRLVAMLGEAPQETPAGAQTHVLQVPGASARHAVVVNV